MEENEECVEKIRVIKEMRILETGKKGMTGREKIKLERSRK